ncbi:hypothetical protein GCM10010313_50850 [Streptomyces violarus]|uniref:Uncharacterized protein n=1 Tax=Streptomyces violarus TaxID=67380 RepID=A0A7W4ZSW6_9ACTN|nr:hypothetical protein [Streptomyces violarus]GHD19533.1 hypothetical protein GCM10010313_50850 [Streptomyces violarus]
MHFEEQLSRDDFLVFVTAPQLGTHDDHFGMPRWPVCVKAAMGRLRGEDEEFFRKRGDLMEGIGPAPDAAASDLERQKRRC